MVLLHPGRAAGQETEQGDDALEDELTSLEEDDFPDLVAVDETGELMDELAFLQDAGMVELASRYRQDIGLSPSAITVLTREDVETTGASSITDLLRLVPGMEIVNLSPFFPSTTGRLNWNFENNSHQILVDGREVHLEVLGFTPWVLLPIYIDDIERIEVIRGPASALYGTNALAGVISITTRPVGERTSGHVFMEGGESGLFSVGAKGTARMGDWGVSAIGGYELMNRWGGNPRTRGKRSFKAHARAEYRLSDERRILVDLGGSQGSGVLPSTSGVLGADVVILTLMSSYRGPHLKGRLYGTYSTVNGSMEAPLEYAGITLARFQELVMKGGTLDGEVQWTVPLGGDQLMLIVGGGGRLTWVFSDQLLDADTFSDINSPGYHQAGFDFFELRSGSFLNAEYRPADWATMVASLRFDYNTETGAELSPRLAAVFQPFDGQFLRLGAARSFRKPSFWERQLHADVEFPPGGPFAGGAEDDFREFMTRVVGNHDLENERVVAFEAGYLGKFFDERLQVGVDLYYNLYQNEIQIVSNIVDHPQWFVDLDESSLMFENLDRDLEIAGGELSVRWQVTREIGLLASWTHREVFIAGTGEADDQNPKNLVTLGGRYIGDQGLLGSLYLHSRSEFMDRTVDNPAGLMEELIVMPMDNIFLVLARLGYRWAVSGHSDMEAGIKLFLPVSPFSGSPFGFRERGGGVTPFGVRYGADELTRVLTAYFKGAF